MPEGHFRLVAERRTASWSRATSPPCVASRARPRPGATRPGRPGPVAPARRRAAARLRPLALDDVALDPAGQLGAWQRVNRDVTLAALHRPRRGARQPRQPAPRRGPRGRRLPRPAVRRLRRVQGARGGRLGARPRRDSPPWTTSSTRPTRLLARRPGGRRLPELLLPGRPPGPQAARVPLGPRDVLRRAPAAGRRRRRAHAPVAPTCWRSRRAWPTCSCGASARSGEEAIDGHPEIETALVELYRLTNEAAYLQLATRFVELRGRGLLGPDRFGANYFQDHAPVREATEPTGHAVRQLYLAAGVTDVYLEGGDDTLLAAMEELWENLLATKTYVTGAHGSRHRDEAFGDPYELPPDRAYAETCAAIASFQWNWRMLLATGRGRYADEMERVLYNAVAAGTSLDGDRFFYSNPLQLRAGHDGADEDHPSGRLEWYRCPCCPPNLARLVASLNAYVATQRRRRPAAAPADRRRGDGRPARRARQAAREHRLPVGGDDVDRRRLRARVDAGPARAGLVPGRAPERRGRSRRRVSRRRRLRPRAARVAAGDGSPPDAPHAAARARGAPSRGRRARVRGVGPRADRLLPRAARSARGRRARGHPGRVAVAAARRSPAPASRASR